MTEASCHPAAGDEINAPAYWNRRFETDWVERGGREQTRFFARLAMQSLPSWLVDDINERALSVYDFGCALGDALPILQDRFPRSAIAGGDVAASAVANAASVYPGFRFETIDPAARPPATDVMFCSNTLEHFKDWADRLEALASAARHHVVIMVPFAEKERISEHEVTFGLASLPPVCGGHRLSFAMVLDTATLPISYWPGSQLIAVYSREVISSCVGSAIPTVEDDRVVFDLRGVPPEQLALGFEIVDRLDISLAVTDAAKDAAHAAKTAELRAHQAVQQDLEAKLLELEAKVQELNVAVEGHVDRERRSGNLIAEHNTALAVREHDLRRQLQSHRQVLRRILDSRAWRMTVRAIICLQRLRARSYQAPTMPPLGDMELPRLDLAQLDAVGAVPVTPPAKPLPTVAATPVRSNSGPPVLITAETLHRGGVEQVVVDLAMGLSDLGHRVAVAVSATGGDSADTLRAIGIETHEFAHDIGAYSAFVETFQPAFALINHSYFGLGVLGARKTPIVEIVHNYYVWLQTAAKDYRSWTEPVTRFAAVSTGVADYHARAFGIPRSEIAVINNPINAAGLIRPEPALLARLRRPKDAPFIFVNVAQFYPAKAHRLLIAAFEQVHRRYPQARLRLIGQHVDPNVTNAVLGQVKRAKLNDVVELCGFVDRRALSRLLATSHAFVQPSIYEGFSVAMAEAAYFALPIVATRVGGAIDLVQDDDCGVLIPPYTDDFLSLDQGKIGQAGLASEAANLPALVAAMERMIVERDVWAERGFVAQARIDALTPRVVAERYVALAS